MNRQFCATLSICSVLTVVMTTSTAAAERSLFPGGALRVTWVSPWQVPIAERTRLTCLLAAVLEGRSGAFLVRDSRPLADHELSREDERRATTPPRTTGASR